MGISEYELEDVAKLPRKGFVKGVMSTFKKIGKAHIKKIPKATGSRVRTGGGKKGSSGRKSHAGGKFAAGAVTAGALYGTYRLAKSSGKKS